MLKRYGLITILFLTSTYAEQFATTDDGKKVVLKDNGTWIFVKDATTDPAAAAEHTTLIDIVKNDNRYDFRKTTWGMNKSQVAATESAALRKNQGNKLEYDVKFMGYNCTVVYTFTGDALTQGTLLIGQDHIDPALFYTDYEALKKYLAPLFGNPAADRCDWVNEMYRGDKAKWGFAVSLGFLTCKTTWTSSRTAITLLINGGNHLIATSIEYSKNTP